MKLSRFAILLVGDTLNCGGTEGQFVEVACRLDRSRWDVHVSCVRAEGPLRARLETAGVRAWSCGRGSFKSPRFALVVLGLARYLRRHRIHLVHSFDFYSNIIGVLAARLARIPVIASQRNLGDLRPPFQRRLQVALLGMARHVLVNCDAVADRLERVSRGHLGRIVVIPNGVDLARFAPAPDQKGHGDRVRIGTLANLRPEKGVEDFVRAAALVRERCPKAHFMIWGEGPLRTDLERLVSALSLEGAVELGGATATPELVLRGLDIFVLPSLSEACSNALLEAMATRLPVVATCVGGNLSIVEDEVSGLLVPPGDTTALAKAITRLIEEPGSAANLAARGQDRIRAEFSMDRMLARIEALYDQALSGRGV